MYNEIMAKWPPALIAHLSYQENLAHLKKSNLPGVSMGFASCCHDSSLKEPTGQCLSSNSSDRPNADVVVDGGRILHVVYGENGNLKLLLVKNGSYRCNQEGQKLRSISVEVMTEAIIHKTLIVDGIKLVLKNTSEITRMLATCVK